MVRIAEFTVSGALAAALAYGAMYPNKIPYTMGHDAIKARIQQLDQKAAPFAKRMKVLEEEIHKPIIIRQPTTSLVLRKGDLKKPITVSAPPDAPVIVDDDRSDLKAEFKYVEERGFEKVCNDTVLLREGEKFEFPLDNEIHDFPDNLKEVCQKSSVKFSTILPMNVWRVIWGLLSALSAYTALQAAFGRKRREY